MAGVYEGRTKAQCIAGLAGGEEEKCASLLSMVKLGPGGAAALGYQADVAKCLSDTSGSLVVKSLALDALGAMGAHAASKAATVAAFLEVQEPELRKSAVAALGGMAPYSEAYAQQVADALRSPEAEVRAAAATALGLLRLPQYGDDLKNHFADPSLEVCVASLEAISNWGEMGGLLVSDIAACIGHQEPRVCLAAIRALVSLGDAGARQAGQVVAGLSNTDNQVRLAAVEFFETVGASAKKETEPIAKLVSHADGRVQAAAAMALGHIKALKYCTEVAALLNSDFEDPGVAACVLTGVERKLPIHLRRPKCAAAFALGQMGTEAAGFAQAVAGKLSDSAPPAETACLLSSLGKMQPTPAPQPLASKAVTFSQAASPLVRAAACGLLARAGEDPASLEALRARLSDPFPAVRSAAAAAIGNIEADGGLSCTDDLLECLGDKVPSVQIAAMRALLSMGEKGQLYAAEVCKLMTPDNDASVRIASVKALADLGERGSACAEDVAACLRDVEAEVRQAAVEALGSMGADAQPFLSDVQRLMNSDPVEAVKAVAQSTYDALRS